MAIDTRPARTSWLAGGLLATVALLLIGGFAVWYWLANPDTTERTENQTYAQAVDRVEFDVFAGSVSVAAGAPGEVAVERKLRWKTTRPAHTETITGSTMRLRVTCAGDAENCSLDYTVRVPPGTAVVVKTQAGDVAVRDVSGEVRLETTAGHVRVDNLRGPVWARTVAGDITGNGLGAATVDLGTEAGHTTLRFATAPTQVQVTTVDGDITVTVPRGGGTDDAYRVRAETVDGKREVSVREDGGAARSISVSTKDGNVAVAYA